jgi:hypothetical protein
VFLDRREGSDLLSVSETARDPPQATDDVDEINHPYKLSLEATMINQNFSQQVLRDDKEARKQVEPVYLHFCMYLCISQRNCCDDILLFMITEALYKKLEYRAVYD